MVPCIFAKIMDHINSISEGFPDRIYLVGFMGSGKSTAGKRLAKRLGYRFTDLDKMIEYQYKTSIPLLFEKYDENAFRLIEQKALHQTSSLRKTVIATGGGTPVFSDNMDFILRNGLTVYIELTPKALSNRLANTKKKRPLLSKATPDELAAIIEEKLAQREDFYKKAHLTVEGINLQASTLAQLIRDYASR